MKKIITVIFVALMLTACANKKQEEVIQKDETKEDEVIGNNIVNPMKEVESLDDLNQKVHGKLNHPAVMGVDNEKFFVIEIDEIEKIGHYAFTINNDECVFRFCDRAPYDKDISGVYIDGKSAFPSEEKKDDVEYNKYEDTYLARWLNIDGQYVFSCKSESMSQEDFEAIIKELLEITKPDGNSQK